MIGFDDGQEKTIILDDCPVNSINSDLTSVVDLSKSVILKENSEISFQGVILRGAFNITKVQAEMMIAQENNPNSRPNTDVIRPRMTGKDVVSHSSNEYVIDFGVNTSLNRASEYLLPIEYLRKNVFPFRQKAKQEAAKEKWWLHWNPRVQMREALTGIQHYIATPRVAKHRLFVWLDEKFYQMRNWLYLHAQIIISLVFCTLKYMSYGRDARVHNCVMRRVLLDIHPPPHSKPSPSLAAWPGKPG